MSPRGGAALNCIPFDFRLHFLFLSLSLLCYQLMIPLPHLLPPLFVHRLPYSCCLPLLSTWLFLSLGTHTFYSCQPHCSVYSLLCFFFFIVSFTLNLIVEKEGKKLLMMILRLPRSVCFLYPVFLCGGSSGQAGQDCNHRPWLCSSLISVQFSSDFVPIIVSSWSPTPLGNGNGNDGEEEEDD